MTAQPRSIVDLIIVLAGPMVWAAHFFLLYVAVAFACAGQVFPIAVVRWSGIAVTVAALAILALFSVRFAKSRNGTAHAQSWFALAAPLTLLSMVAILWTSMPLFLLPVCTPGPV